MCDLDKARVHRTPRNRPPPLLSRAPVYGVEFQIGHFVRMELDSFCVGFLSVHHPPAVAAYVMARETWRYSGTVSAVHLKPTAATVFQFKFFFLLLFLPLKCTPAVISDLRWAESTAERHEELLTLSLCCSDIESPLGPGLVGTALFISLGQVRVKGRKGSEGPPQLPSSVPGASGQGSPAWPPRRAWSPPEPWLRRSRLLQSGPPSVSL